MEFPLGKTIDPTQKFYLIVENGLSRIVNKSDLSPICSHRIPEKDMLEWLEVSGEIDDKLCPECVEGFATNIETKTLGNENYREVFFTSHNIQLVVMSLAPKQEIGGEEHEGHAQFIRVESGVGRAEIGGKKFKLYPGMAVVVPQGIQHNIINTSKDSKMKLYTIYCPPVHPKGTLQKEKPL